MLPHQSLNQSPRTAWERKESQICGQGDWYRECLIYATRLFMLWWHEPRMQHVLQSDGGEAGGKEEFINKRSNLFHPNENQLFASEVTGSLYPRIKRYQGEAQPCFWYRHSPDEPNFWCNGITERSLECYTGCIKKNATHGYNADMQGHEGDWICSFDFYVIL